MGVWGNWRRSPWVTVLLVLLCIGIALLQLGMWLAADSPREFSDWWIKTFYLIPNELNWYSWLTSLFMHADFLHLFLNLVFLFVFGAMVEGRMGNFPFVLFFLVSGIVSGVSQLMIKLDPVSSALPGCGISGVVAACMGFCAVIFGKRKLHMQWVFILLIYPYHGRFSLPAWIPITFWFGCNLVVLALVKFWGYTTNVGLGTHLGGLLFGVLIGGLYKWAGKTKSSDASSKPAFVPDEQVSNSK